jgi:GntR family transcriptional regulator, rspAB operon transcriptional repressor
MNELFRLIWCGLIGFFRSRTSLEAEILVLRHQLNVLRRKSPKRPTFGNIDRLIFAALYSLAPNVRSALAPVADAHRRDATGEDVVASLGTMLAILYALATFVADLCKSRRTTWTVSSRLGHSRTIQTSNARSLPRNRMRGGVAGHGGPQDCPEHRGALTVLNRLYTSVPGAPAMPPFETARERGSRLYDRLRNDILCGRLRPGEALSESRLAEQHGISRTPVREVIQRLAKENLLAIVPQIGTFVAPIKLSAVTSSQFIREALECRAVRFATELATRPQVEALRQQISRQEQAIAKGNHVAFFLLDDEMHSLILDIAGHPHAWDLIASVKAQLDRVRYLSLEDNRWLKMIYRQHREIVAAIRNHDPLGAEQAMQEHLRTVFDAVERIAQEHAEFFEQEPTTVTQDIA